ncbi:long-chain-fatty-acid--CoA ligase FadD19 [Mycobacteroides abscessus subsp. abscessus]|nr:long-chain-fatty-acid--CoA ligase FadD19 [Mycobacteroides abscessus subsp. abscessus]
MSIYGENSTGFARSVYAARAATNASAPAGKADYRWAKEVSETEKVDLVNSKHVNTGA